MKGKGSNFPLCEEGERLLLAAECAVLCSPRFEEKGSVLLSLQCAVLCSLVYRSPVSSELPVGPVSHNDPRRPDDRVGTGRAAYRIGLWVRVRVRVRWGCARVCECWVLSSFASLTSMAFKPFASSYCANFGA